MKSRMLISMLVIALAAAVIGGATMAWFTDSDQTGDVTFTAGTLKIDVSEEYSEEFEVLEFENMNPGDVYDPIEIVIENVGTKKLAWFGNWDTELLEEGKTDALLDGVYIDYAKMEFLRADETNWETVDEFIVDGVGAGLYPGLYDTLAGQSVFRVVALRQWIDNAGMAPGTPYEHMGALLPGNKYKLTIRFGFHKDADNDYQGDVASAVKLSFKVDATQVKAEALEGLYTSLGNHEAWLLAQIAKQEQ